MQQYTQYLFVQDQKRSLERLRVRLSETTDAKAKRYLKRRIKSTEAYLAKMQEWELDDVPAELKELED